MLDGPKRHICLLARDLEVLLPPGKVKLRGIQ